MLKLAEEASAKNLKVGVGLMSRHSRAMQQLADRIHGGEIGDVVLLRGYRMHGPLASSQSHRKPADISEVAFQIRRFHSFLWASGGCFNDFYIHIIDQCCWMKNAWPVQAQAIGGRHYRGDCVDQNFDTYGVEYTFADGTKFIMDGRCIDGCDANLHQLRAWHEGDRDHLAQRRLRHSLGHVQGPGHVGANLGIEARSARAESLSKRMERPGRRHPPKTSPTTK